MATLKGRHNIMHKDNNPTKPQRRRIVANTVGLISVFLFMAAAAIMVHGRLLGHSVIKSDDKETEVHGDTTLINTTSLAADINGYGGPVPVEIAIVDGRIASVSPLPNSETPGFFHRVEESGLLDRWNGLTPREALETKVDGVTGATFTSKAIIANVNAGLQTVAQTEPSAAAGDDSDSQALDAKSIAVIAVILAAMSLPLFVRNIRYRRLQQLLNVAVLGFWGGTFVDYTMMLSVMSGGLTSLASISTILLLIAAFVYPLFGRDGHYCAWVCPLGSLQELASAYNPHHRIHLSARTVSILTKLRMILWGALMLCLWTSIWLGWIDYELFTAFIVESAATAIIIAALLFTALSIFIPRPYCRFVCPTGTLLRMSQNIETK